MNLLAGGDGKNLPNDMQWLNEPPTWGFDDGGLTIVPRASSDFFLPYEGPGKDNCCLLYQQITGDFTATAEASAELADFGDAAAVTIRASEELWAKLCLERSPIGDVSLVSVVTNPWSDDANSEVLASPTCFLRLTRKDNVFGMHYSLDSETWRFVRTFALDMPATAMVGIQAQAPFTAGCRVLFKSFTISPDPVLDYRSGE